MSFVNNYTEHFQSYRHNVSDKARQYASGLMQAGSRKNMDRMAEVVPKSKSRNLQQFLTHSKWDHRSVIDHVARDADNLLGHEKNSCLLIDESSFEKQGKESVGVSRQWLGRFGKVDNGQVAVFGALANSRFAAPIDVRFYLPEQWTDDPRRCERAGVPEQERQFRTKTELALKIVRHSRENKLRFGWVGADSGYGKGPGFCCTLDEMGETFVVDVHSNFHVYLQDPQPYIPKKTSNRGRPFTKYKTDQESIEVREVLNAVSSQRWKNVNLRKTSRGLLKVRIFRKTVYVRDGESNKVKHWSLIATQSMGDNADIKISLTNAPNRTTLKRLGWMQRQRYWIERVFEDTKSECGMADYQVRKWSAWHHHMALVMMAMLFMTYERIHHKDTYPLLSCADIEELLAHFLPRRDVTREEVILQLEQRHIQRQKAIESHTRCQKILFTSKKHK
ncbi:MAG: IS701 family transposase, partial [Candidatus Marinimicrobia bacterium]|nr:IS701 family transposase [Candidatus Neomarinimicrobiota bacterium]